MHIRHILFEHLIVFIRFKEVHVQINRAGFCTIVRGWKTRASKERVVEKGKIYRWSFGSHCLALKVIDGIFGVGILLYIEVSWMPAPTLQKNINTVRSVMAMYVDFYS